jgi:uroporphyrinogen decarboxylase
MKINMNEWIASILASKERKAIPVMTHSGIEMLGHTVYDAVTNGEVHYKAVKLLAEKYPSAASTMIMDLTVEAEAFGAQVDFSEKAVPTVVGRLVSNKDEVEALEIPSLNKGRIPEYLKANRLIASEATKPVLSGCIGPYSLAGRLFDMTEIMMAMFIDPECVKMLLSKCSEFIKNYCLALKEAGSNGVVMAEPAAGLLSNDACYEFSSVYIQQIIEEVQDESFAVILHNCGNRGQCTDAMVRTGAKGFHFGNGMDMLQALNECPQTALVMGNLDPVSVFKMASKEEIYNKTMELLQKTTSYPNFVISSGCDTPPEVPIENVEMFYQAVADFNNIQK